MSRRSTVIEDTGEVDAGMAMTPRISPRADAAHTAGRPTPDVVAIRPGVALVPTLRTAAGFRVDGPDGRIGVLRGIAPARPAEQPERLLVAVGLFNINTVSIAVADVRSVDVERRRIVVATTPPLPRRTPAELAHRVRRFVRTAARRAARNEADATSGRQT
jgi:hypothetical protein